MTVHSGVLFDLPRVSSQVCYLSKVRSASRIQICLISHTALGPQHRKQVSYAYVCRLSNSHSHESAA
jgi:hypothetical protein